jgi:anti-sigma B factor antagonist
MPPHSRPLMKTGLTITESTVDGVQVLKLAGYLDGHTFVDLERKFEDLYKRGKYRLVIDLSGLNYIASAGVGALINSHHQASSNKGSVQLANAGPNIKEIFDILGLDSIFTMYTSVQTAVKAAQA